MLGKCSKKVLVGVTAVCGILIWLRNISVWLFDQQTLASFLVQHGSTFNDFIQSGFGSALYYAGYFIARVVVYLVTPVLVWVACEVVYRLLSLCEKR